MNNFKVLENLNQNTSLIIIDESTIALDDRFFLIIGVNMKLKKFYKLLKVVFYKRY